MNDQNKESEENADESFWESVEQIAKNIIKVVKDTIHLIKSDKEKPS